MSRVLRPLRLARGKLLSLGAGLLFLTLTHNAAAQGRTLSLKEAVQLAQQQNFELRSTAKEVDVAKSRVAGASVLLKDNPVLAISVGPRTNVSGRSLDYGAQLTQQIEIAGQRGARIDAAESSLRASNAQLAATRAVITARVRTQFGRTLAMAERVRLAEEALVIVREGKTAAEERLRAGAATQLELNTADVEQGRALRLRSEAQGAYAEALAELQFLVGLDPSQPVTPVGELKTGTAEAAGAPTNLIQHAIAARPELQEAKAAADSAKAEEQLASREWVPSPRIGASVNREEESRTTIIQGILSIDVPVFNRNAGPRGITKARTQQALTRLSATEHRIKQDVVRALARLQAARAAVDGYTSSVVSAMQQNMELVVESYRAGKIDFLQLIVIRRQVVDARAEYIDVLEE
ncbi:MAG TPA: TolC family protein, partial [Polyangiales bacterium]|nr:TolC family protein [Polyangiales bacterium]